MKIEVKKVEEYEREYIEIGCHKVNERIREIVRFVKMGQGSVEAFRDEKQYQIAVADILYVESVDDRCFLYLKDECYESKRRLYEFEEALPDRHFARISKAVIVNLMKVSSISPALGGRFFCELNNGEKVIISRKYVPAVREKLKR